MFRSKLYQHTYLNVSQRNAYIVAETHIALLTIMYWTSKIFAWTRETLSLKSNRYTNAERYVYLCIYIYLRI